MIIRRQKTYSVKNLLSNGIRKVDGVLVKSSAASRKRGAKVVAKSVNKDWEKQKIAEIREKYKNSPKIAERKITQFLSKSKRGGRIERLTESAQRKLEVISPSKAPMTEQQVQETTKRILQAPTPKGAKAIIKSTGKSIVNGGRSVMSGVGKVYTGTGQVLTDAGALVRKHPLAGPGWLSGDVINAVGSTMGHPEVLAVPAGTIAGSTGLAIETLVLPRKAKRKLRQKAIKLRKKAANSGFSDWSLQKTVREANKYHQHLGTAGQIGYIR